MRRIGIMGGTFNPIHNGHLAIAEKAREQFALEKVLFMPSGVPYMKAQREVLPIQIRCEMTALAIKDTPGFKLSEIEASDAAQAKNTYTCDTLRKLRRADPKAAYYFILGADSLYAMESWKNPELIFRNCTVLAAVRRAAHMSSQVTDTVAKTEKYLHAAHSRRETDNTAMEAQGRNGLTTMEALAAQAQYLSEKYHASVELLEFAGIDISSTQIREKIRKGESLQGLVPEAVETYIVAKHLYLS